MATHDKAILCVHGRLFEGDDSAQVYRDAVNCGCPPEPNKGAESEHIEGQLRTYAKADDDVPPDTVFDAADTIAGLREALEGAYVLLGPGTPTRMVRELFMNRIRKCLNVNDKDDF